MGAVVDYENNVQHHHLIAKYFVTDLVSLKATVEHPSADDASTFENELVTQLQDLHRGAALRGSARPADVCERILELRLELNRENIEIVYAREGSVLVWFRCFTPAAVRHLRLIRDDGRLHRILAALIALLMNVGQRELLLTLGELKLPEYLDCDMQEG